MTATDDSAPDAVTTPFPNPVAPAETVAAWLSFVADCDLPPGLRQSPAGSRADALKREACDLAAGAAYGVPAFRPDGSPWPWGRAENVVRFTFPDGVAGPIPVEMVRRNVVREGLPEGATAGLIAEAVAAGDAEMRDGGLCLTPDAPDDPRLLGRAVAEMREMQAEDESRRESRRAAREADAREFGLVPPASGG